MDNHPMIQLYNVLVESDTRPSCVQCTRCLHCNDNVV